MVIPYLLFLDMVPSSSANVTRALRGCFRGGFVYVSFRFKAKENLPRRGDVFFDILISKKQRSFGPRYVLNTFRNFDRSLNKRQMSPAQTVFNLRISQEFRLIQFVNHCRRYPKQNIVRQCQNLKKFGRRSSCSLT